MSGSLTPESLYKLRNNLAITLSVTVKTIGPMPDIYGEQVRAILSSNDPIAMISLGLLLEACNEETSYRALGPGLRQIRESPWAALLGPKP